MAEVIGKRQIERIDDTKIWFLEIIDLGFRGSAVVENPPANAGDTGSIPGPGRSHMLQSN